MPKPISEKELLEAMRRTVDKCQTSRIKGLVKAGFRDLVEELNTARAAKKEAKS